MLHDPHTLSNYIEIIESVDAEEAEKRLVILSTNTIIQKFAMMIKLLCAPITSITMMAGPPHLTVTQDAEY